MNGGAFLSLEMNTNSIAIDLFSLEMSSSLARFFATMHEFGYELLQMCQKISSTVLLISHSSIILSLN